MADVMLPDLLVEGVDESVVLLSMIDTTSASRPTSALVESIWNGVTHPRWPPHTKNAEGKDIGGEFMRAGQTFMHDGQRWDIAQIADGHIIANEASGDIDKVETKVFSPAQLQFDDGEHPTIVGASFAPPIKLTSGKSPSTSAKEQYTAPIVDGDASNGAPHDPLLALPAGSPLSQADWEKFGLADQLYYRELMNRYGPWEQKPLGSGPQSSKVQQVFSKAHKEFGTTDAADIITSAITGQKGSSKGYEMNLVHLFKHLGSSPSALVEVQKKYARVREVQAEINGVIAYDLYNRLKSPDISVKHKASEGEGFFGNIVKGSHAVMSGLSTSWTFSSDWGEPNTLGFAMPIRHLALAEQVTGMGWGSGSSEHEIATADRVKVNPGVSAFWSPAQVPNSSSNPLWKWLTKNMGSKPAPGAVMKAFAAHLAGKADLPGVAEDLNFTLKHKAGQKTYYIPPDDFMKHVEEEIAKDPGKKISDKEPWQNLDLKPGDIIQGSTDGFRYMVISDPGYDGLTYVALGKGAPGNYDSPDKLYHTTGSRYKIDKHFDVPPPPAPKPSDHDPNLWVPDGEPVKIGSLPAGSKIRIQDEYGKTGDWEITHSSTTSVTVKNLETGAEATVNPLFKTAPLMRATAQIEPTPGQLVKYQDTISQVTGKNEDGTYALLSPVSGAIPSVNAGALVPLQSIKPNTPQKGDTFAANGKKYTVTTVLKNGTVKAKPSGGAVESFASDHPALAGMLRPTDFEIGEKSKLKNLTPGDLFSGSAHAVRPYMVLTSGWSKAKVKNLDTGEVMDLSANKSYPKLSPVTTAKGIDSPLADTEWGDIQKPDAFQLGDSLDGKTYGDFEVGDKILVGQTTYMVTDGHHLKNLDTGTAIDFGHSLTGVLPYGAVFAGHDPQPGHLNAPAAVAGLQPGEKFTSPSLLHVGAVFVGKDKKYKVVADKGAFWDVTSLAQPGSSFKLAKAIPGNFVFVTDDGQTVENVDASVKALVDQWKNSQSGLPTVHATDMGFVGYKNVKHNDVPHDLIKDMPADAKFVDSKGNWWKKVGETNADGMSVITNGVSTALADGSLRGKLAEHVAKAAPDIATPHEAAQTVDNTALKPGDVVATLGDHSSVLHITGSTPGFWQLKPIEGPLASKNVSELPKAHSPGAKFAFLGHVPLASSAPPTPVSSIPVEPEQPTTPQKAADLFRGGSGYVANPSTLPPFSFVQYKGNVYYKSQPNPSFGVQSEWFPLGSDQKKTSTINSATGAKQVYPPSIDPTAYTTDGADSVPASDVKLGDVISVTKTGTKYLVIGKSPKGFHALNLNSKTVAWQKNISSKVLVLKATEPAPPVEPEIETAPSAPSVNFPAGFVPVPPNTNVSNAGLKVGDDFIDEDGDHHHVLKMEKATDGTSVVHTIADGISLGTMKWAQLGVAAIKHNAPVEPEWQDIPESSPTGLMPGDQYKDADGDIHTVEDVSPGHFVTTWNGAGGTHTFDWNASPPSAVAIKKASPNVVPSATPTSAAPIAPSAVSTDPNVPVIGIPDYSGTPLTGGSSAGGTTGAQMKDGPDGKKWLLKTYGGNQDRVASELLANAIYRQMGLKAANAGKLQVGDKTALAYPLVDGKPTKFSTGTQTPKKVQLGKGLMTDVLVANRDFVGLDDDNVLWNGDEPTRVDQGGSFHYRAQGAIKPYGPNPAEDLEGFLTKGQAVNGVTVSEEGLRAQAAQIAAKLPPSEIDKLVDDAGFKNETMKTQVAAALKSRVAWMQKFADGKEGLPSKIMIPDVEADIGEPPVANVSPGADDVSHTVLAIYPTVPAAVHAADKSQWNGMDYSVGYKAHDGSEWHIEKHSSADDKYNVWQTGDKDNKAFGLSPAQLVQHIHAAVNNPAPMTAEDVPEGAQYGVLSGPFKGMLFKKEPGTFDTVVYDPDNLYAVGGTVGVDKDTPVQVFDVKHVVDQPDVGVLKPATDDEVVKAGFAKYADGYHVAPKVMDFVTHNGDVQQVTDVNMKHPDGPKVELDGGNNWVPVRNVSYEHAPSGGAAGGQALPDGFEANTSSKKLKDLPDGTEYVMNGGNGGKLPMSPGSNYEAIPAGYKLPQETTEDTPHISPGSVPHQDNLPITPYLWHKGGGGISYAELSTLEPGQKFADKKGKQYTVKGVIVGSQHKGNTPALGKADTSYVQDESGQTLAVPHSFIGAAGSQKGKTLPTRVKAL